MEEALPMLLQPPPEEGGEAFPERPSSQGIVSQRRKRRSSAMEMEESLASPRDTEERAALVHMERGRRGSDHGAGASTARAPIGAVSSRCRKRRPEAVRVAAASRELALRKVLGTLPERRTEQDLQELVTLMAPLSFFRTVSSEARAELCAALDLVVAMPGQVIYREGDHAGERLYIVTSGEVAVHVAGEKGSTEQQLVGTMGPGSEMGAAALIRPFPRYATITATSDGAELAVLERTAYHR
eukprot:8445922-Pyramimonas_sp.AAC.1